MSHFKNERTFDITTTDSSGSEVLIPQGFIPLQCLIIIDSLLISLRIG